MRGVSVVDKRNDRKKDSGRGQSQAQASGSSRKRFCSWGKRTQEDEWVWLEEMMPS